MEVDWAAGSGPAQPVGATAGCYNYVVTAHKPTAVTHAVVANFTGANDVNLITACCTRLEIHTLVPGGLQAVLNVPIYGSISALQAFRPRDSSVDLLFLLTEKYKFCVLAWDAAKGQLLTRANGDASERIGRPADNGQLALVDPAGRAIALHLYDGILKIIPMDERTGALSEAFNCRLEELSVLDVAWLAPYQPTAAAGGGAGPSTSSSGTAGGRPLLAVLHQDLKGARHVKTYEVAMAAKDLADGPWQQQYVDSGAAHLLPLPAPLGGVVVLGENTLTYLGGAGGQHPVSAPLRQTIITAWCLVDPDGSRFLLGDRFGALSLLVVAHDGAGRVSGLRVEQLGHASTPSCLAYLDSGLTYVGSRGGDSQLLRISATPVNQAPAPMQVEDEEDGGAGGGAASAAAPLEPPSYLEVVDTFPSLGPITDFVVMDLERQGQGQVVTCSGIDGNGSLRVIRNGIGIAKQATVELPGIKGVWSLRASYAAEHDTYLLLTFVGETRVLALNAEEELDEAELPGLEAGAQTLWCGNAASDHLLQVTSASVRLVDPAAPPAAQLVSEWRPPAGHAISVAAGSPTQVVVATGGGRVVCLEVAAQGPGGGWALAEAGQAVLGAEVACVDCSPLGPDPTRASLVAVGRWDQTLQLLTLPGLTPAPGTQGSDAADADPRVGPGCVALGGEVIPRSVLLAALEGVPHCMVGLGDGALHTWRLEPATGALSDRKRVVLGTKPISLRTFRTAGSGAGGGEGGGGGGGGGRGPGGLSVFAASDRPTVVYSSNKKLLYSNLNENDVSHLASFHAAAFPHSLAVASEAALTLGAADAIQRLHTRTVPLGEQPRRVAHAEAGRVLGVLTQRLEPDGEERGYLRVLDDTTFEVLASFGLQPGEMPCSLAALPRECTPAAAAAAAGGGEAANQNGGGGGGVFAVGTALIRPDEPEPSRGRLLVLEHVRGAAGGQDSVRLIAEKEVKGAAYSLLPFAGDRLLVAVNSKVTVYRWVVREGPNAGGAGGPALPPAAPPELASECSYLGNILALYLAARGNLVVVGDLMKSVSLLSYNREQGLLELRAADYATGWTTAVEALDDDTYIAADNHCNLYCVRRNAEAAGDEERARLQVVAEFHAGSFTNRFRHGSLVMRLPDSTESAASLPPPLLFAGTDGRLGVIARLPPSLYELLSKLQAALRQVVRGVGGLEHEAWRAFANDRRAAEAPVGFIDGDLIEMYLDLPPQDAARVASLLGPDVRAEELTRRVEDLARGLH